MANYRSRYGKTLWAYATNIEFEGGVIYLWQKNTNGISKIVSPKKPKIISSKILLKENFYSMLKKVTILIMIFGLFVLSGCSTASISTGDSYSGQWLAIENGRTHKMVIKRNDDTFLVTEVTQVGTSSTQNLNSGATLTKEGILKINNMETITYNKSDDTLRWSGFTFKRDK